MCEMQKYLPPSFFNAQEHYLIHQVEEIEMCGPVHTRSMWNVLIFYGRHIEGLSYLRHSADGMNMKKRWSCDKLMGHIHR